MSAAPAGGSTSTTDVREEAGDAFIWQRAPAPHRQGQDGADRGPRPDGLARTRVAPQDPLPARRSSAGATELAALDARCRRPLAGDGPDRRHRGRGRHGQVAALAEFVADRRAGAASSWRSASASRSATNTSYFVWREIWRRCFGSTTTIAEAGQRGRVEAALAAIDPELVAARAAARRPLLGVEIPDNELTASFDAKLRKASLEDLLADRASGRGPRDEPLVLVLEDCHWIDPLSRDLLEVARAGRPPRCRS